MTWNSEVKVQLRNMVQQVKTMTRMIDFPLQISRIWVMGVSISSFLTGFYWWTIRPYIILFVVIWGTWHFCETVIHKLEIESKEIVTEKKNQLFLLSKNVFLLHIFHPSIFITRFIPFEITGCQTLAYCWVMAEYTLNRSPTFHRATQPHTQYTLTLRNNLE